MRFGRLVVIDFAYLKKFAHWNCICDCGNKTIVRSSRLTLGRTKSCGCLVKENYKIATPASAIKNKTHGDSKTRLYGVYHRMTARCCYSKNKDYKDYGGRGITVCSEWLENYEAFRDWAVANGYNDNSRLTIDRIDVNGNYEPSNCRWVTNKVQQRNKRNNRLITIDGITKTIFEWAEIYKIGIGILYYRLKNGMDAVSAITKPVKHYNFKKNA